MKTIFTVNIIEEIRSGKENNFEVVGFNYLLQGNYWDVFIGACKGQTINLVQEESNKDFEIKDIEIQLELNHDKSIKDVQKLIYVE